MPWVAIYNFNSLKNEEKKSVIIMNVVFLSSWCPTVEFFTVHLTSSPSSPGNCSSVWETSHHGSQTRNGGAPCWPPQQLSMTESLKKTDADRKYSQICIYYKTISEYKTTTYILFHFLLTASHWFHEPGGSSHWEPVAEKVSLGEGTEMSRLGSWLQEAAGQ